LFVRDLMVPIDRVPPVRSSTTLVEVIDEITKVGIGAIWVRDESSTKGIDGIITDGDLRRALKSHSPNTWASLCATDIMTKDPITIEDGVLAVHAIERMERNTKKAITLLPVVDRDGNIAGILRLHDLVQAGLITQSTSGD
jgi:arabinose-5-phosphate isomerase